MTTGLNQLSLNLGLDLAPLCTDEKVLPDLYRVYNAIKLLNSQLDDFAGVIGVDPALWSTSGADRITLQNLTRYYVATTDNLTVGQCVNVYNVAGVAKVRKSGGGAFTPTRGFVLANYTAGDFVEVFLAGVHNGFAGLTPGVLYYTSDVTAGAVTATPPASPNRQAVGYALSASQLWFQPALLAI